MPRTEIKHIILLTFLFLPAITGCATTIKERVYKFRAVKKGHMRNFIISGEQIDNEMTLEVYFKLNKQVDCTKVRISSYFIPDKFTSDKQVAKVFFIIERLVDVTMFSGAEKKFVFTEIGRNYNEMWDRKRLLTVCTDITNPVIKLDKSSIYRIRFATFLNQVLYFNINIQADSKITIVSKPDY